MKLIYCICETYNPGGMERVLLNKVRYLVEQYGYDITVVTTDQNGRAPFYPFPEKVKMVDLGINYSEDNTKGVFTKILNYLRKRRAHRRRLTEMLMAEKADIVVSLYPSESSFIPSIKDGSKKVLEIHYCKYFRLQYGRRGLLGAIDRFRTWQDEQIVRRFDKFVVLSQEDKGYWGKIHSLEVIPNAALFMGENYSDLSRHRVIAVGRLDYQKGFDRLIEAWKIIHQHEEYKDWTLDIFGQGEWKEKLQDMIEACGLQDCVKLNAPTKQIGREYANSSMLVMSSNYEGFPMVMIEAMACGLPAVSFDFKCGPKDIIQHGVNGLLVKNGDIQGLADAMMHLMADEQLRQRMSSEARKVVETYSEEVVMRKWLELFDEVSGERLAVSGERLAVKG